jgi:membrane-associated phospholipid phosphatase
LREPNRALRLRAPEWLFLAYFIYAAVLPLALHDRPNLRHQPIWVLLAVALVLMMIARAEAYFPVAISCFRDFLPLGLTLVSFEEMNLFAPQHFDGRLEQGWIRWDHVLLHDWHFRAAMESFGWLIPVYLEFCYLLVYGLGTYCIIVLYVKGRRADIDRFFLICLTGTLVAYALFPYFPSQPPRIVFPGLDDPAVTSWLRRFNLWILRKATIHAGVFPSAHVSSAFAAAWAMFVLLPKQKRFGWGVLIYAISVSVATIYGRYHYAADVAAGFGVSLIAAVAAVCIRSARGESLEPSSQQRSLKPGARE